MHRSEARGGSPVFNALVDNRSAPGFRAKLDDFTMERGWLPARLGVALWVAAAAAAAADDADADAAAAAADADAAADDADAAAAAADAAADAAAAADADADADAAAADADAIRKSLHQLLTGEIDMRDGLKVIQVPGRYGYSLTLVGWLKRIVGDEFEIHNACTVARTGNYRMDGLQKLASEGPKKGYDVTEPAKLPEEIHRLLVRRALPASVEAWAKACPRPKNFPTNPEET
jgi:hypothetical protein